MNSDSIQCAWFRFLSFSQRGGAVSTRTSDCLRARKSGIGPPQKEVVAHRVAVNAREKHASSIFSVSTRAYNSLGPRVDPQLRVSTRRS